MQSRQQGQRIPIGKVCLSWICRSCRLGVPNHHSADVFCVAERVADEAAREAARLQQQQEAEAAAAASLLAAAAAGEQQPAEGAHSPGAVPAQQQQAREGHVGSEGGAVPPAESQETAEERVTRLLEVGEGWWVSVGRGFGEAGTRQQAGGGQHMS